MSSPVTIISASQIDGLNQMANQFLATGNDEGFYLARLEAVRGEKEYRARMKERFDGNNFLPVVLEQVLLKEHGIVMSPIAINKFLVDYGYQEVYYIGSNRCYRLTKAASDRLLGVPDQPGPNQFRIRWDYCVAELIANCVRAENAGTMYIDAIDRLRLNCH